MNDDTQKNDSKVLESKTPTKNIVPSQMSAQDTSNWDKKELTAPNGRVIIETKEKDSLKRVIISE
jgi:hypothetical protein